MAKNYLSIGIKDRAKDTIVQALRELGFSEDHFYIGKDCHFEIQFANYADEFQFAQDYLKEQGLEDESEFFRTFDILPYANMLDFTSYNLHTDLVEATVCLLGRKLSSLLETECIVFFNGLDVPVCLFSNGAVKEDLTTFNPLFFERKFWKPKPCDFPGSLTPFL